MLVKEKTITLKNNKTVLLRSATKKDAQAQCDHWAKTAFETSFLARYPEECTFNIKEIENELQAIENSQISFMINAFDEKQMVANARIVAIKELQKFKHRGYFIISIIDEYTNSGLGKIILNEAKKQAIKNGFTQIELGLFEDNARAKHVYQKSGFIEIGRQPRAFKQKDGSYKDEILMVCFLDKENN